MYVALNDRYGRAANSYVRSSRILVDGICNAQQVRWKWKMKKVMVRAHINERECTQTVHRQSMYKIYKMEPIGTNRTKRGQGSSHSLPPQFPQTPPQGHSLPHDHCVYSLLAIVVYSHFCSSR